MIKRLTILSVIIVMALTALSLLGYHALGKWAQGLEGARLGEYAQIAEQVRKEVKIKLDAFLDEEEKRPYTDYLYYHVSEGTGAPAQAQQVLLRSPLSGRLDHALAYGHFQIEPDGRVTTPNDDIAEREGQTTANRSVTQALGQLRRNIETNLRPVLIRERLNVPSTAPGEDRIQAEAVSAENADTGEMADAEAITAKALSSKGGYKPLNQALQIDSLQRQRRANPAQLVQQNRAVVNDNLARNTLDLASQEERAQAGRPGPARPAATAVSDQAVDAARMRMVGHRADSAAQESMRSLYQVQSVQEQQAPGPPQGTAPPAPETDTVQIRIEPLVPVVVPGDTHDASIFGGQVFMLRHVLVDHRHFLQGFKLNEAALIDQVRTSAQRLVVPHTGLTLDLSRTPRPEAAYAPVLDFGFGELILNLVETDPGWIAGRVHWLKRWYGAVLLVVTLAVGFGLAGLWQGMLKQLALSRQKDDFISAVSHELRTPLTSIRMYAEMLEKDWVKDDDKRGQYYTSVRQESERLARLVENVLDFSRIQRGKKQYRFALGDLNACVDQVIRMMQPYAAQQGFRIDADLGDLSPVTFDQDAVIQIVVNLLDNAIKYARETRDKTLQVRTRQTDKHTIVEVEDHGPGIPHTQRQKIFDAFYRTASESTRQTTGTGLGLALVKRFAEAHHGSIECLPARSGGALFRVLLSRVAL